MLNSLLIAIAFIAIIFTIAVFGQAIINTSISAAQKTNSIVKQLQVLSHYLFRAIARYQRHKQTLTSH